MSLKDSLKLLTKRMPRRESEAEIKIEFEKIDTCKAQNSSLTVVALRSTKKAQNYMKKIIQYGLHGFFTWINYAEQHEAYTQIHREKNLKEY